MRKSSTDIIKKILIVVLGVVLGNILYLRIFRYWVFFFWGEPSRPVYLIIIYLWVALICEAIIWILFKLIYREVSRVLSGTFFMTYVILLSVCLIGPNQMESIIGTIEFNLFSSIKEHVLYENTYIMGVELLTFIPIGAFFGNRWKAQYNNACVGSCFAAISVIVELLQYTISGGSFRMLDVIIYLLGMIIGYIVISIEKSK